MSSTIVTVSKDLESKADLDKLNHESDDSDDDDEGKPHPRNLPPILTRLKRRGAETPAPAH